MIRLFAHIFNMSMAAGWVVLAILLLRLLLRKAPKWIFVMLWGAVALRLLVPAFAQSPASLVPSAQTISPQVMQEPVPQLHIGISAMNHAINPVIAQAQIAVSAEKTVNVLHVLAPVLTGVWLAGCCGLLGYCAVSYLRIRKRVATAVPLEGNVYESEGVTAAFLLGLWKPKIYLPFGLNPQERQHIIAHERAHIGRKDHLWKPFGFLLLTVYWFHPLMWLAYWLLCRDIELACDEKVAHSLDASQRADYSQTLLNHTVKRSMISACPLAFGQGSVKRRVKSVLNYKKPTFWILLVAIVAVAVLAVCFLTDPPESEKKPVATIEPSQPETEPSQSETEPPQLSGDIVVVDIGKLKRRYPQYFGLPTEEGLSVYIWQMAENSYSCALLPGKSVHTQEELWEYHKSATTIMEMRAIVNTYELDQSMVAIRPIQMWHSSYAYTINDAYTEGLETLFWEGYPVPPISFYGSIIDSATFDIDADGIDEQCTIGYGPTSGLFTIVLSASENGTLEYYNIFYGPHGLPHFMESKNGIMRLWLATNGQVSRQLMYDISVEDGNIVLTPFGGQTPSWNYWGMQGVDAYEFWHP